MLVLTRKLGEAICIGDKIVVKILRIHNSRIRLGIDAPAGISVRRAEIDATSQQVDGARVVTKDVLEKRPRCKPRNTCRGREPRTRSGSFTIWLKDQAIATSDGTG